MIGALLDPKTFQLGRHGIVLAIACFFCFLGRAWQHLIWDPPYRALLWSQEMMEGLITSRLGISWNDFVTNPFYDAAIQNTVQGIGWVLLLAAFASLPVRWIPRFISIGFIGFGALVNLFLSYLYYRDNMLKTGELLEFGCQVGAPVLLLMVLCSKIHLRAFLVVAQIAIATTFFGHGLYAIGYYPVPGYFVTMTMQILRLEEPSAVMFLKVAGILDFLVAALIFIPKINVPFLAYSAVWGFLTALARVFANYSDYETWNSIRQWGFELLVRIPNALVPVVGILLVYQLKRASLPFAIATKVT